MPGSSSRYIHGSKLEEQTRLSKLNDILNKRYIDAVDPRPGDRILDLGSGLGQFTAMMAERAGEKSRLIGIERDPRQITTAKKFLRGSKQRDRIEFRQGDVTDLALGDAEWGRFDLVHTRFLLEHLPDPGRIVKMMAKAVRPAGRVFISDDDHDVFRLTPEPGGFRGLWRAYVRSYELLGNDPYVGRKLVALMRDAGLGPVRNGGLFFGGCAGEDHFEAIADNLIGILDGAGETILGEHLITKKDYDRAMKALREWKHHPAAAQWYVLCWAEGIRPVGDGV